MRAGAAVLLATAAAVAQPAGAQGVPARQPAQACAVAGAATDSRYRLATISHGIKLTLIAPRRAYPLDSLTQVTVRVENMSGHAVVANSDNICNAPNPRVESITGAGSVLFPPPVRPFSDLLTPPCPRLTGGGSSPGGSRTRAQPLLPGLTLAPGAIAEGQVYVVVRSRFLRISAVFNGVQPGHLLPTERSFTVTGPALRVGLLHASPARAELCSTTQVCVRVAPPARATVRSPLLYAFSAECTSTDGVVGYSRLLFEPAHSSTIRRVGLRGCTHPPQWRLVAGWLDQPVVYVSRYVSGAAAP